MTRLCHNLYHDFDHVGWNEYDLATLPANELRFLCAIMGAPYYGIKADLIVRLLALRIVRMELSKFPELLSFDAVQESAKTFSRDRLRWMCIQANLWKSGTKIQLFAGLLKWRNECRLKGQKFLSECIAYTKQSGLQLELPIS